MTRHVVLALLLALCTLPAAAEFRAACVQVDITPDTPQWLHGYAPRQSTGVHDRIYHRIAALDDGETTFYLVATDCCTISPSYYDAMTRQLEAETGITPAQIWWSTTHTHSAPHVGPQDLGQLFGGTLGDRFSITHDTAYWDRVTRALIEGVKEARAKLEPARLGVGIGEARANINRRELRDGQIVLGENPEGPVDRQLGLIRLERSDGSPIGLIANYAIHGTCLHGGNTQISGDAPGWVSQYVEAKLGVPLLFVNGAEGNVAPFPTVGNDITDPRIKSFESTLGDPILALNASIQECASDVSLRLSQTNIVTPRKEGLGWIDELADYARVVDGVDHVRIPIRGLVINGDTAIWAAPLELFSEIAMNIREASPFARTMYFGLTNGSLLYLPTKAAFAEGGYEPNVSPFREQAEEDFTSGVSAWLTGLK
ncbi:MAG: neutral/alkaline non-lysosomal ceramidase N-terminal domain-containing protein [Candidatus Hydrogenedentes bacterium]|nr:neutral/alkaline non-lysosomal ceramidase N-terminal domain-containing protein [Candidatus Hydrogenedentota bacterium]